MRCSNCGFPLSPSRNTCPRCGVAVGGAAKEAPAFSPSAPFPETMPASQGGQFNHVATEVPQQQWNTPASPPSWANPFNPGAPAAQTQQAPFPTPGYAAPPRPAGIEQSLPFQGQDSQNQGWLPSAPPMTPPPAASPQPGSWAAPSPMPRFSYTPQQSTGTRSSWLGSTRRGFGLAGICLIAGALLLIFVSILAQNGSPADNGLAQTATPLPTQAATHAASTPTPGATPTPAFPGQAFIDHAQMASQLNEQNGQVIQTAMTFTVNQKVYVSFAIHPAGQNGVACLKWYQNNAYVSDFAFDVYPTTFNAYSYAKMSAAGPAYVEIYWSHATSAAAQANACQGDLLAQHVDFTVS